MKLISKFHDYYDFHASNRLISDQTRVWERTTKEVPLIYRFPVGFYSHDLGFSYHRLEARFIFFCGSIIPVLLYDHEFFYTFDSLPYKLRMYTKYGLTDRLKAFFKSSTDAAFLDDFLLKTHNGSILPSVTTVELHRELNSPVFSTLVKGYLDMPHIQVNPNLAELGFMLYMDAFTVFQKLENFIANELVEADVIKIPQPSDKLKVHSHGFDNKSFRKAPSKRIVS